jgi:hypothetical protein
VAEEAEAFSHFGCLPERGSLAVHSCLAALNCHDAAWLPLITVKWLASSQSLLRNHK